MRLEKQEACQLYIEQQIEEGLEKGQTPYKIGKEVAEWVEKLFEVAVKPKTIAKRAERQIATNVANDLTALNNKENGKNKEISIRECPVCHQLYDSDSWDINKSGHCPYCFKGYTAEGKPRQRAFGAGRPPKFKVEKPAHRTQFSGDNEWYTPTKYIEAARNVMGEISLDPATTEYTQRRIRAINFFTIKDNGLEHDWHGNVWLNPPYSQPLITQFIEKAVSEWDSGRLKEMIILTHNSTDTSWFHKAESVASLLCFTRGRIRFEHHNGKIAAPTQGQCFFYYGDNTNKFKEIFVDYGFIR